MDKRIQLETKLKLMDNQHKELQEKKGKVLASEEYRLQRELYETIQEVNGLLKDFE